MTQTNKLIADNYVETNKLIAEFMGVKIGVDLYSWRIGCTEPIKVEHLNYHKEWGWLMPVVEKIEMQGAIVEIWLSLGKGCRIVKGSFKNPVLTVANTESNSTIEAIYSAVVQFIEWYNTHPSTIQK
jgi:hypothetical protein